VDFLNRPLPRCRYSQFLLNRIFARAGASLRRLHCQPLFTLLVLVVPFVYFPAFAAQGNWSPEFYIPTTALGAGSKAASGLLQSFAWAPNGNLIAAGSYTAFAGIPGTSYIAQFDGERWFGLAGGANGPINAILAVGTNLYAAGNFNRCGGVVASNLARWDGLAWHSVGDGVPATARALAWKDGSLYVGGNFTNIAGLAVNGLARWDGANWSALQGGVSPCRQVSILRSLCASRCRR
jgi:hypothetical protein